MLAAAFPEPRDNAIMMVYMNATEHPTKTIGSASFAITQKKPADTVKFIRWCIGEKNWRKNFRIDIFLIEEISTSDTGYSTS